MVERKMYQQIQSLKKQGSGKLAIGRKLKIDPATVRKYYPMNAEDYLKYQKETLHREKIFDDYKDEIKSKFDNIESELSTRKSAVAKSDNPFKKDNAKYDGDWFENPNLTEEDKGMMFAKYISGNK